MDNARRGSVVGPLAVLLPLILVLAMVLPRAAAVGAESAAKPEAPAAKACNLRPTFDEHGLEARAQGKRPTCSVFTVTQALEFALAKAKVKSDRLSVEFLNWASNQANGEPEDGSLFSDLWKGFAMHGACAESDMPYLAEFDAERRPSDEARRRAERIRDAGLREHWIKRWNPHRGLDDAEFDEVKKVLRMGWPVCGGFLWPKKGLETYDGDVLKMLPRDKVRDGHSVLLVGYRDDPSLPGGGAFLIRNSGGGLRHGEMPYAYAKAYMNDAIWIDNVDRPEFKRPRPTPWWLR